MDVEFLRHRLGLVPKNGAASLALLRQRFDRAESELSAARAAMRSAADSAGIERAGLFSDSVFIKRTTGDRWHEAGITEGHRELIDTIIESRGGDPAEVRRGVRARLKVQRAAMKAEDDRWKESGIDEAIAAKNYAKALAIFRNLYPEFGDPRKVTAAAVLAAGRRARMSGSDERPLPPEDSLAAKVILAGKRRRGEIE